MSVQYKYLIKAIIEVSDDSDEQALSHFYEACRLEGFAIHEARVAAYAVDADDYENWQEI